LLNVTLDLQEFFVFLVFIMITNTSVEQSNIPYLTLVELLLNGYQLPNLGCVILGLHDPITSSVKW
jgi:hypothetical protein